MSPLNLRTKLFIATIATAGLAVLGVPLLYWHSADPGKFVVYFLFSLAVSRMKVKLPGIDGSMSVGFLFILIGAVELGLGETALLASVSTLVQCVWKTVKPPQAIQVMFNVTSIALAAAATHGTYHGLQQLGLNRMLSLAAAACVYFLLNTFPVSIVIAMTEAKSTRQIWSECYFWSLPYYLVGASIAGLCSWLSSVIGWEGSLLVLPVIYLLYRSYFLYLGKLEEEKKHVEDMAGLHMRTIESLALAIEAKDTTTHNHLQRVRIYALELGKLMNIAPREMDALRAAALLHDIGKLGVPEHIINKPGKLTPEEFEKMKTHPLVGAEILERVEFPYPVVPIVRAHHEKWDGSGYPLGLHGEQIPIGARILSAVDCLDALASDRQYRRALPLDEAMGIVIEESGKAFDPAVVNALQQHYVELEQLVNEKVKMTKGSELSVDVHVEAGAAPDAGFEHVAASEPEMDFISTISSAREEAQILFELSQDLSNSLRLDDTLSVMSARLRRLTPYDAIAVYLVKDNIVAPAHVSGDNYRALSSLRVPLDEGLIGWVAANGKPIINGDPAVEFGYRTDDQDVRLQSVLAIPLEGLSGVVGVVCLYRRGKEAFSNEHVRILLAVSSRVALSIENAVKFEQAETSSVTDYLTGLPNARSLFVHLDKEVARCKREKSGIALMVCDLDGFKQINDRFGHLEGNRVLKIFADQLRGACREYDYVARMGGDEFVVVLPGLTAEAAGERSELVDQMAKSVGHQICKEDLLSASIGAAFYPSDGANAEQLLAEADRRMYTVKRGRHLERAKTSQVLARSTAIASGV